MLAIIHTGSKHLGALLSPTTQQGSRNYRGAPQEELVSIEGSLANLWMVC